MEHKSSETKLSVLVVDDCESIRGLLETLLSRNGHRCESAANGVEAMVKVTQSRFDVVITDVLMQPPPIEELVGIDAIFVSYLKTEDPGPSAPWHENDITRGIQAVPNTRNRLSGSMAVTP